MTINGRNFLGLDPAFVSLLCCYHNFFLKLWMTSPIWYLAKYQQLVRIAWINWLLYQHSTFTQVEQWTYIVKNMREFSSLFFRISEFSSLFIRISEFSFLFINMFYDFFIKPIMMFPIVIHIQDNPKSSSSRLVIFSWILVYDSIVFYAIFNLFLLLFLVDFSLWCYVFLFIYLWYFHGFYSMVLCVFYLYLLCNSVILICRWCF